MFRFLVTNHGQVPAIVTGWNVQVTQEHRVVAAQFTGLAGVCIFPRGEHPLDFQRGTGPDQASPEVQVQVKVQYSGYPGTKYSTFVVFNGRRTQWRILRQNLLIADGRVAGIESGLAEG
jgi:hypothetical protein